MTKEEAIKSFEEFDLELDFYIDFLNQFASQSGDKYFPLDHSMDSLTNLENLYRDFLNEEIGRDIPSGNMDWWLEAYLGISLIKEFDGGHWKVELDENLVNFGMPGVCEIPGLAESYSWCPFVVLNNFKINKYADRELCQ